MVCTTHTNGLNSDIYSVCVTISPRKTILEFTGQEKGHFYEAVCSGKLQRDDKVLVVVVVVGGGAGRGWSGGVGERGRQGSQERRNITNSYTL